MRSRFSLQRRHTISYPAFLVKQEEVSEGAGGGEWVWSRAGRKQAKRIKIKRK